MKQNRVLFVDDEPAVTGAIKIALRKAPFEVLTANSGREALSLLGQEPVDVVVSDERMPGMCGSELLSLVRVQFPDTVRMILSGQSDLQAAVRAINEGGIFRFLLKPCSPEDLASSVEEALDSLAMRRNYSKWQSQVGNHVPDPRSVLQRALTSLYLVFQPIVDPRANRIVGHECLLRLADPSVHSAAQLFGMAEGLGQVPALERAIRKRIARELSESTVRTDVFINVHPLSLLDERIYDPSDPLTRHADRIVFELTEHTAVLTPEQVDSSIARLRNLGYRVALDDLGSSHSGLSDFSLLTPDVVKFNMELIRGIHLDGTRSLLVQSMVALCHEMGIPCIAEGVETPSERECVVNLGCDWVQGFLVGRPERSLR
ncbi:MAG: EAL domain-containing protein [Planctomycetota bacterium]